MGDIYFDLTQREGEYDKDLFIRCLAISCESAVDFLALVTNYSLYEYLPNFDVTIPIPNEFKLGISEFGGEHAFNYYYAKAIRAIRNNGLCHYCDIGFLEDKSIILNIDDSFKIDSKDYPVRREIEDQINRASTFIGLMDNYLRDCETDERTRENARGKQALAKDFLGFLKLLNLDRTVPIPKRDLPKARDIIINKISLQ